MVFKIVLYVAIATFIAGALLGNYIIDKGKDAIGSFGNSHQTIPEIKVTTPIEEIPPGFVLPRIDMGKAEKAIIIFPSTRYGEIRVEIPVNKIC